MTYNPYELLKHATTWPGSGWFTRLTECVQAVYQTVVLRGLARLYVYGPPLSGFGGWQGRSPESICSQLSPSNEQFWLRNMDECDRLIAQHFHSWVVLFEVLLYFWLTYHTATCMVRTAGRAVAGTWRWAARSKTGCSATLGPTRAATKTPTGTKPGDDGSCAE